MPDQTVKTRDAYRCSCPGCGSVLKYDIRSRAMLCESCQGTWPVETFPDESAEKQEEMMDTVEYTCPSCGASVHTSQTSATSFCSYCGSEVVLTERLSHMRRPDAILPFRITREECESRYRGRIREAVFAPKSLLKQETINHFRPVYIPFWRYSYHSDGETDGLGQKTYSDSSYNYIDSYSYKLAADINITNLFYDASSAFDDETAMKLNFWTRGQYDTFPVAEGSKTVPFHPAYLCGMYAESPDAEAVIYKDHLLNLAHDMFNTRAGLVTGSEISLERPKEHERIDSELVLLPVWLLANRTGERVLYTAVNGDTGNVICDTPVDRKRFIGVTALLFAGILVLLLALTKYVILRPNLLLGICGVLAVLAMRQIIPDADRILIRRQHDTDPTRAMKLRQKQYGESDVSVWELPKAVRSGSGLFSKAKKTESKGSPLAKALAYFGLAALVYLATLMVNSSSSLLSSLISDRGFLVPIVLVFCLVLLCIIRYRYPSEKTDPGKKKTALWDVILLYIMRALIVAGIIVSLAHTPGISLWCYALSIAILILLSVNIVRVYKLQNEYVTRPVPFFGKEGQE